MSKFIRALFKTATLRQSSITLVGTLLNGVLGMVFYILTARWLGPVDFGLLTLAITTLTLVADIADFGTNTGLVKFVSGHLKTDKEKAYRFLKLSLMVKLAVYLMVLGVGWVMAPWIALTVFQKADLIQPLRLAFVGVGGAMLFSYLTAVLQALEKFKWWSGINIGMNSLRVGLLGLVFSAMVLSVESTLLIYILMPVVGFVIGCWLLPIKQIIKVKNVKSVAGEMYRFNRWVALFVLIAAISSRLDTFLAGRFLDQFELGIYGASNQLALTISQLVAALGVVVAPKFASFDNKIKMLDYFKKVQWLVVGLGGLILLSLPVVGMVLPTLYGAEYQLMVPIFSLLVVGMLFFLLSVPIHNSLIYYYGRSDIFVWVALGHLAVVGLVGWWLVQSMGVVGLALTVGVGMVFNLVVPGVWWWRLVKR